MTSLVATQIFLEFFTPKIGEMSQFDDFFSMGLKPPTSIRIYIYIWVYTRYVSVVCSCV